MKKTVGKKVIVIPPNLSKVASIMGRKKFNDEIDKEIRAGVDPKEAPNLIARRKLQGII